MNIQITKNSSPLRTGLYYLAMLVGVALTILLVACPAASSNDSGGALDEVSVKLTSAVTGGIIITVPDSVTMESDTTLWWAVFEEGTTLTDNATLTAIVNLKAATPVGTVTVTSSTTRVAMLLGNSGAAGVAIEAVPTNSSTHPVIMDDLTMALVVGREYAVFMAIGGNATTDRILSKQNITAVLSTAPIPTCDANDATADCDDDTVANGMDNCPAVANMDQLNTDNRDDNIATGGDALGDVCDVDDDDDGVNDVDSAGNALDRFVLNACASRDSDDDMLPDEIIDPAATNADRCSEDEAILLINLLAGLSDDDSCAAVTTATYTSDALVGCADTDDDNDGTADTSDVDLDNDGLIEIATLEALNNIRYNLAGTSYDDEEADSGAGDAGSSMGCASGGCNGYELTRNLDFAVAASYAGNTVSNDWCPGPKTGDTPCVPASPDAATMPGFVPIGTQTNDFVAILDGNLFTINNLYIHNATDDSGLLGSIEDGTIRRLGLTNVSVSGAVAVGGLVGGTNDTTITAVGVAGTVTGNRDVGGLAGNINGSTISGSWSSVTIIGSNNIGGLVGTLANINTIYLSYARGSVMISGSSGGGLIGQGFEDVIRSSWASVTASGGSGFGGVIGSSFLINRINVSDVYWDSTATTSAVGIGAANGSPTGLSTTDMQAVGGANFGGSSVADRFGTGCGGAWVFSDATTMHFPKLREIISGADTPADCSDDTYGDELPGQ